MNLLLYEQFDDARTRFLGERLETPWELLFPDAGSGPEGLAEVLARADAVISMGWAADMPAAPRLRLIQLPGAGLDKIDFDAVPAGAAVCNVYEHETGIAEYLVLALLEWQIRLRHMDADLRRGRWTDGWVKDAPLHGELAGKRVGFIGYGRIARETARRLRAFGVSVSARTRSPETGDEWVEDIAGMDRLHEMLAACDYVVVTCPLTEETRGLVDAAALSAMKPTGVLLNVARGEIVDEDALFGACREGRIGGAVVDTWYRYPQSDDPDEICPPSRHPFHELDNVIMTPHASGWSEGLHHRRWTVMAANLDRLQRGEPLLNCVQQAST